ncbi:Omp28-related outer membrane protein, partial [Arthrospira platensis SPKY1]|nr:Omp28-related outer membrane protein [Arthrospira platensis SPKY1]
NSNEFSNGRANYYGVTGIPFHAINGRTVGTNATALNTAYTAALAEPAFFSLDAQYQLNGTDLVGNVNVQPFISGNFKLHVAVVENLTTLHPGSNGETSFKHVLRRMAPTASGTTVNFSAGVGQSLPFNMSLSNLAPNQLSNLSVIVFIQNDTDKVVMQSSYVPNTPLS